MFTKIYKFILFSSILSILSCTGDHSNNPNNSPLTVEEEAPPRLFLVTQTRRLRVRQTPDLEGTVLKILRDGVLVEYLHDSTSFTTPITYNRVDYNASWYKIQADDKSEGWVYSAFVKFLSPTENQKVVNQRETAELLEAANELQPKITKKQKRELTQPVNDRLVRHYKTYLSGLNKSDPNSVMLGIEKFKLLFIGTSNVRTCDAAYMTFHYFYNQVFRRIGHADLSRYQHLAPEIKRYHRATMQTDTFTRTLGNNGFNFSVQNGRVVLAEDVDFLFRIFYRECSTPMRAYMNQYELEEPPFWIDGEKLLITPKKLARWVLSWNYFVATYPNFIAFADAKKRLERKFNILLQGTSKTPAFAPKTFVLNEDFLIAYRHIAENYPESKIGKAFQEYLQVLEANDWKSSEAVTQGQNKIMRTFVL